MNHLVATAFAALIDLLGQSSWVGFVNKRYQESRTLSMLHASLFHRHINGLSRIRVDFALSVRGGLLIGTSLWCASTLAATPKVTFRIVARTTETAPGLGNGVAFADLFEPTINSSGRVAFRATLVGTGVSSSNNSSIWSDSNGSLALVSRRGSIAPGTTLTFSTLGEPVLNDAGRIAFFSTLSGTGVTSTNDGGIWSQGASGDLSLVAREGSIAPGASPGVVFGNLALSELHLSSSGRVCFGVTLAGSGVTSSNDVAIGTDAGGSALIVAREGSPIPAPLGVATYTVIDPPSGVKADGRAIFRARFSGSDGIGVFTDTVSGPVLASRLGDQAPGFGTGVVLSGTTASAFGTVLGNAAGQVAFRTNVSGPGIQSAASTVVMAGFPVAPRLVGQSASSAPGTPTPATFSQATFGSLSMSSTGRVAFIASVNGPGILTNGIWSDGPGSLSVIALNDYAAPGCAVGVVFASLVDPLVNSEGRVAFAGTVAGPGVTSSTRTALWATDSRGLLRLVVRAGSSIDVDPDPVSALNRTVGSSISMRAASNARGFSDSGEIAFLVTFDDGTKGVLVASVQGACPADVDDGSGTGTPDEAVTIEDLLHYLATFASGTTDADIDNGALTNTPDGGVGIEDLLYYLARFEAGC